MGKGTTVSHVPVTKAVIFWPESKEVSIEELWKINEEDRFVGATSSIQVGNKNYPVIVRLISKDQNQLQRKESEVADEIDRMLEIDGAEEAKRTRKERHRKIEQPDFASYRDISAAVGEKVQPTQAQKEDKKCIAKSKKETLKAQEAARDAVDASVIKAKRSLKFAELDQESLCVDSEDDRAEILSGAELSSDGEDFMENDSVLSSKDINETRPMVVCQCAELRAAANKSPSHFITSIAKFLSSSSQSEGEKAHEVQYLELLAVPNGVPKCEVSKGSQVFIAVHDKNEIKTSCHGDPAKMIRDLLFKLYGRLAFENEDVTALGTKKGSKGIRENVRSAVLSFVNRNRAPGYPAITTSKLTSVINKKKHQVQRAKLTPTSSSRKSENKAVKKARMNGKPSTAVQSAAISTPSKSQQPSESVSFAMSSTSPWKEKVLSQPHPSQTQTFTPVPDSGAYSYRFPEHAHSPGITYNHSAPLQEGKNHNQTYMPGACLNSSSPFGEYFTEQFNYHQL